MLIKLNAVERLICNLINIKGYTCVYGIDIYVYYMRNVIYRYNIHIVCLFVCLRVVCAFVHLCVCMMRCGGVWMCTSWCVHGVCVCVSVCVCVCVWCLHVFVE